MKLSSYCFHDLKMIILYRVMLNWFLPELRSFGNFLTVSLVSATPLAVFCGFLWNLPVIVAMTWRGSYYTEVTLDCFLPELWPLVNFSHLSTKVLVFATPPTFLRGYWRNFPVIVSMTWRWSHFIEVILNWFLPELRSFGNILTVILSLPLAVFIGF